PRRDSRVQPRHRAPSSDAVTRRKKLSESWHTGSRATVAQQRIDPCAIPLRASWVHWRRPIPAQECIEAGYRVAAKPSGIACGIADCLVEQASRVGPPVGLD